MGKFVSFKRASLLLKNVNYAAKKFYDIRTWKE